MMPLCVILSVKKLLIEPVVIRLGKEAARYDRAAFSFSPALSFL